MGKVITGGTMSLDGYIAGPEENGFDLLFQCMATAMDIRRPVQTCLCLYLPASAELIKPAKIYDGNGHQKLGLP